jgi:hypothetical protein
VFFVFFGISSPPPLTLREESLRDRGKRGSPNCYVSWQETGLGWEPKQRQQAYCTDKKENKIFLIYKELQKGSVAKSNMTNGLLIYG